MQLSFTKMHGLGNDFLVARGTTAPPAATVRALADRHTGIGFDQLLWLENPRSDSADVYYRVFNADGGEVEQCGNGARCIARFLADENPAHGPEWRLESMAGVFAAQIRDDGTVAVAIGVPSFRPADIPFEPGDETEPPYTVAVAGREVRLAVVSVGNPHAVLEVDDIETAPVAELGPALEAHERFPNRANIGFMQVTGPAHIRLRVFERGVGETSACGTGACAAVAAGRASGKLAEEVTVALPGGELRVRWAGEGAPVWLSGEAVRAFEGVVAI